MARERDRGEALARSTAIGSSPPLLSARPASSELAMNAIVGPGPPEVAPSGMLSKL
jgi:hypothetical protein